MTFPKEKQTKRKRIRIPKEKTRNQLIKELDKLVSNKVRERAEWKCERCHKQYTPPTQGLHCSHYYSRRFLGTRWDLDNLMALCMGCHKLWEGDKQGEYTDVMKMRLDKKVFDLLRVKAYTVNKYSKQDIELLIRAFES